jgi:pimeloyl-ACP methyl ester carboxylesterase
MIVRLSIVRTLSILCGFMLSVAAAHTAPPNSYRMYVAGPWGQIHVRVMGSPDAPAVLLVHKMVWSSLEFSKAQPFLAARGVRSIAVDLPGYGLSDGPDTQPNADAYADSLLPVLNALHLKKLVLAGVNTGATIVTAFALRHPDRTLGIVLDGPPIFKGAALAKFLAEPEADRTARPDGATLLASWKDMARMGKNRTLTDETIQAAVLQFFQAGPHYLFAHRAIFSYDLAAGLDRVKVPITLLTYPGDQLRAVSLALKASHPGFRLVDMREPDMTTGFKAPLAWADFQAPQAWADALADDVLAH